MRVSIKGLKTDIQLTLRGYGLINKLCPKLLPLQAINAIFNAVSPILNIYVSGLIIDALYKGRGFNYLMILVLIMAGTNLLITIINCLLIRVTNLTQDNFWLLNNNMLSQKINSMDYQSAENPAIHNMRQRIQDMQTWSGGGLNKLLWNYKNILNQFFKIVFSIALVFNAFFISSPVNIGNTMDSFIVSPVFSLLVIVLIIFNTFFAMRISAVMTKKSFEIGKGFMHTNRLYSYFAMLTGNYRYGKDIRIYNQKDLIIEQGCSNVFTKTPKIMGKMNDVNAFYGGINSIASNLVSIVIYVFVALRALAGLYSVGGIVQYVGGIQQFINGFSGLMSSIATLRTNTEALELLFEFLDLSDDMYKGTLPIEKRDDYEYEFEFHDVSFKYPGSEIYVLKNLNLKVNIGERMAVVGMNGSGKTTMIKLLCRLYDPTEGFISLNDVDIKKYDYEEYLSLFSVVFQDFQLFSYALGQNVAADTDCDRERAEECLVKSGLGERLYELSKKLDTCLYKDFEEDGVEISGGEAQKIAIARALYKDAPFIILDEPTAALDPIAEFEIYSKFNDIVGGKTAIYISHRLSSCRFCDDIAVFDEGKMIQRGSHDTLILDVKGKYYELWNAQAQYYSNSIECVCNRRPHTYK